LQQQEPSFKEGINIEFIFENEAHVNNLTTKELPTLADIGIEIYKCDDFAKIMNYIVKGELPADEKQARKVVYEAENFDVENGVLYHLFTPRNKKLGRIFSVVRQLCIPTKFREQIACGMHDRNCHIGFDRLYATIRARYFWPGMYAFLKEHVKTCLVCQKTKTYVKPGETPIVSLEVPPVAHRWHLDFHGAFPVSDGFAYILVIIDSTSLWVELVPTVSTDAEVVVKAIFDNIVARHGLPRGITVFTDNGAAFTSRLSAAFCKNFGIRQLFSTPYHQQSNTRAESVGDVIHKSLRTLVRDQKDWSRHLQAVAMAYRASATSSLGLSPYEIMFGRKMNLEIDWGLLAEEAQVSEPEAYAEIIKPKLEILNRIAMENAKESAEIQANKRNQKAIEPKIKPGDKVLLHDPVTRRGDSSKLRPLYKGPYFVIEAQPGFNFKLKDVATGKEMKRMVHASRLRPLREHPNDYRESDRDTEIFLFQGETENRKINIRVIVGDIVESDAEIVTCLHARQHDHSGGVARAIADAVGDELKTTWPESTGKVSPDEFALIYTPAGNLNPPVKQILHVIEPASCIQSCDHISVFPQHVLQATVYHCLSSANDQRATSIAIPAVSHKDRWLGPWEKAQAIADAIQQFDRARSNQGFTTPDTYLKSIEISNLTLDVADVMSFVFRDYFRTKEERANDTGEDAVQPAAGEAAKDESGTNGWFEIDGLIKHRRKRGVDEYLVKWKGTDELSWQKREDITEPALQHFYAMRKTKKRRRRT
jgi:O-acetyl-ADP-ribose deacetylase (regulator of RNase III)